LNALADNPELEQEERDRIRESFQAVSKSSSRDYTKFQFEGQAYAKNRLVLAVVKKHVENNPEITVQELTQAFTDSRLPVIIAPIDEAREIADRTGHRRHFVDEPITLIGAEIAVNNQWGAGGIEAFIDLAESLGYSIVSLNQTDEFRGWIRSLIREAKEREDEYVDIVAGDIVRGKLQGNYQKSAMVCSAMKSLMREGDEILKSPPSGLGSSLTIRYFLQEE